MKVRVVTSQQGCLAARSSQYINSLNSQNYDFETYDADLPEHQEKLDKWGIQSFPVVQILENDKLLFQFPEGAFSIRVIELKKKVLADMIKSPKCGRIEYDFKDGVRGKYADRYHEE